MTNYETDSETKEAIELLFRDLVKVCRLTKTPMYATVAVKNSEEGTEYETVVYNAASHDITLKEDRIRRHMLIADGFDVVPPREVLSFDPFEMFVEKQSLG